MKNIDRCLGGGGGGGGGSHFCLVHDVDSKKSLGNFQTNIKRNNVVLYGKAPDISFAK